MSRAVKVSLIVAAIVLVLLVGVVLYARPLLYTATGYAAHNACAVELLADRPAGSAADDLPPNPLVPYLGVDVDREADEAAASLFGLFRQTALMTEGVGCVLAEDRPYVAGQDLPALDVTVPPGEPWPTGDAIDPEVAQGRGPGDLEVRIDEVFNALDDGRVPGTRAVVVVHEGEVIAERYTSGFDAETPQLGWSMGKSLTNAMVGRMVQLGDLDVDERALLPAWADDDRSDISLDQLLHMSSGLEWDETYDLGTPVTEMLYLREDMGEYAAGLPLAEAPGTYVEYSSGTTNIICDVLHQRSGLTADLAHQLVLDPIGMRSAVVEPDAAGDLVCSSYVWATPRDWARLGLLFAQDGIWEGERLLPEGWVEYSSAPSEPGLEHQDPDDVNHAAHWWTNRLPDGDLLHPELPEDTFWASGHDGQRMFVIPSEDLVVLRMGFTPDIPGDELGLETFAADVVDLVR